MSVENRVKFLGLVTNASSLSTPEGALLEAENVVIRRSGCVEPRDGLTTAPNMNGTEVWGLAHGTRDLFVRHDGTSFTYHDLTGVALTNPPHPLRPDILTSAQARGNLYVPGYDGVWRLLSGALAFETTGLANASQITGISYAYTTGAPPHSTDFWLPRTYHVNYRLVGLDTDPGGMIRRSAPSAAFEASFPAAASPESAAYTTLTIATMRPAGAGYDSVEIYRSRVFPIGTIVDDEMQLVGTIAAPPFGSPTFFDDKVPQDERGATLYTSPSRGGAIQQNDQPPACACVALFKSSLFFANTRGPARLIVSFTYGGNLTGQATGIGVRTYTGTSVLGNAVVSVSSTVGLAAGQVVFGPGMGADGSVVVSVGAGTVTISPVASAGAGAGNFGFLDRIWLGTTPIDPVKLYDADAVFPPNITATQIIPPMDGKDVTWVLTSDSRAGVAGSSFTVRASHGGEYSPPLPGYSSTAKDWDQDVWPGGIMWSKPDEPEHVAPVNYAFVGDLKKAILGLVPTRDALFILKEDGVFRLTGVNATWRIDPYDPTLFCCLPNSVYPLQEMAYFLSNKGVIAFSDAGSEIISLPINDQIKPLIDIIYKQFRTTGLYELPSIRGSHAAVFERENEYTMAQAFDRPMFVYNRNTSAWATFQTYSTTAEPIQQQNTFTLPNAGRVAYVLKGTTNGVRWTFLSTDAQLWVAAPSPPKFDLEAAISIASATGVSGNPVVGITLAVWRPMLKDDVIVDAAGRSWRVTANSTVSGVIQTAAQPNPATPGSDFFPANGAGFAYRTVRCTVTPQVFSSPPPRPKRWRALSTAFERFESPVVLRYAYASAESPRAPAAWDEEETDGLKLLGVYAYPMGYAYAGLVPTAHARAWSMRGSVRWAMSHGRVRLEGIYVEAEMMEIGRQQRAL